MSPLTLNPHQLDAATTVDEHLLVTAGAGTGKTFTVVGHVAYLLGAEVEGRVLPAARRLTLEQVAAITFTRAAAADLQRKLRAGLRDLGAREPSLREAGRQVDTARIGTIHSFCREILGEFALRGTRPPARDVLEDTDAAAQLAECVRDGLIEMVGASPPPGLERLLLDRRLRDVEKWAAQLAGDSGRLRVYGAAHTDPDEPETALVALALRALERHRELLAMNGAIDYDAIVVDARDLIASDASVRQALQRRIRCLIIDEFQDVDPIQREIAYLLGEPLSGKQDTTRLFLVGDAKQSIFRFRRADVSVWNEVEREFENGAGRVVRLETNYRSAAPILGFVDATVGELLGTRAPAAGAGGKVATEPWEVPHQPLSAAPENVTQTPCVELLRVNAKKAGETSELEYPALAARIQRWLAEAPAGEVREPGDVAVLVRSWDRAAEARAALESAGLRTHSARSEGFFDLREVLDCGLALRVLRDPCDDVALVGFLRSPFASVRDETLLALAVGGRPLWRHLDRATGDDTARLDRIRRVLEPLLALRDRAPAEDLLERLLLETGYLAYLRLRHPDDPQPELNLRKLLRLLRGRRGEGLADAVRFLEDARAAEVAEGEAPIDIKVRNAVRLGTIHGAKGLEWRVVFWAGLSRGKAVSAPTLVPGRDRIALKPSEEGGPSELYDALAARYVAESVAEENRLWYVAATRAKELLVVSAFLEGEAYRKGVLAAEFDSRLGIAGADAAKGVAYQAKDAARTGYTARVVPATSPPAAVPPASNVPALPLPAGVIALPSGRQRHSASETLAFQRCARRHWLRYVLGLREPDVARTGRDFIDAVTRGHIVHDVLENLREESALADLLEGAIARWDEDAPPPETRPGQKYRAHLQEEVVSIADHPDYRAVADLPNAVHELSFLYLRRPARQMEGAMDLAGARPDGLVIIDVKTSQLDAVVAAERAVDYTAQRDVYVEAAGAVSGLPVAEFGFQFSKAGVQVRTVVSDAERAMASERVGRVLDGIERGDDALTEHPHECCFCGYREAGWCEGVPLIDRARVGSTRNRDS